MSEYDMVVAMVREIILHNGMIALCDEDDFPVISRFNWTACESGQEGSGEWYARCRIGNSLVGMHTLVLGTNPSGYEADHINGNGLDNRKTNLRFVTRLGNLYNRGKKVQATSRYKGVHRNREGKWIAVLIHNYERHYIGAFDDEVEAAKAWDRKARELRGEQARLNFA